MPCRVAVLPADREFAWNNFVLHHPHGTLFHTTAWREAVRGAFGHRDFYLTAERGGRVVGALPLVLVSSRLAGRMLVSVPYAVGGGILSDDPHVRAALLCRAFELGGEHRCRIIDLRSARAADSKFPVINRYVGFRRELPDRVEDVATWLPRKARAAARNARDKFGLTVSFGHDRLQEVWRLYSINMRRLGSICYPYRFFATLLAAMPERTWVSVITQDGAAVAGLVSFAFKETVMPYFYGASPSALRCSAANFAYFTLAEHAVAHECRVFDFGRSRRDNPGSYDFKRFHGFEPRPLEYQQMTLAGRAPADLTPTNPTFAWARRVWPHLPLWFTRAVGARLARHIPG